MIRSLTPLVSLLAASNILLASWLASAQAQDFAPKATHPNPQLASPQIERGIDDLLQRMTLEEKLGQLVQYNTGGTTTATTSAGPNGDAAAAPQSERLDAMQLAERGLIGSLLNVSGAARVSAYQHAAVDKSRLHVPLLIGADVLHGYRTGYPIPLALAASFDPELVSALSRVAAQEATPSGIRWFYAPMVDISRDARWGRTAEGAGEDAFLGSAMARAYVRRISRATGSMIRRASRPVSSTTRPTEPPKPAATTTPRI